MHNFLSPLFHDPRGLELFEWHIGNCFLELLGTPRTLILAGSGGGGKSTALTHISSMLGTCCSVLPPGTFTTNSQGSRDGLSKEVIGQLVGSRMVLTYDVDLEKRKINAHAVKGYAVRIASRTVRTHTTKLT